MQHVVQVEEIIELDKHRNALAEVQVDLEKFPDLRHLRAGLTWGVNVVPGGHDFDLDLSAVIADENGYITTSGGRLTGLVGYARPDISFHGVTYGGDNRTGVTDTNALEAESLDIELSRVGKDGHSINLIASIYAGRFLGQSFDHIHNAMIYLENVETGQRLAQLPLKTMVNNQRVLKDNTTGVVFGSIRRTDKGGWEFFQPKDLLQTNLGLSGCLAMFGLKTKEERDPMLKV